MNIYTLQSLKCHNCPNRNCCPLRSKKIKILDRVQECTWYPFEGNTPESEAFKRVFDKKHHKIEKKEKSRIMLLEQRTFKGDLHNTYGISKLQLAKFSIFHVQ